MLFVSWPLLWCKVDAFPWDMVSSCMTALSSTCRFMKADDDRRVDWATEGFDRRAFINSSPWFKIWKDILIGVCGHAHFPLPLGPVWFSGSLEHHSRGERPQERRWRHRGPDRHCYEFRGILLFVIFPSTFRG